MIAIREELKTLRWKLVAIAAGWILLVPLLTVSLLELCYRLNIESPSAVMAIVGIPLIAFSGYLIAVVRKEVPNARPVTMTFWFVLVGVLAGTIGVAALFNHDFVRAAIMGVVLAVTVLTFNRVRKPVSQSPAPEAVKLTDIFPREFLLVGGVMLLVFAVVSLVQVAMASYAWWSGAAETFPRENERNFASAAGSFASTLVTGMVFGIPRLGKERSFKQRLFLTIYFIALIASFVFWYVEHWLSP